VPVISDAAGDARNTAAAATSSGKYLSAAMRRCSEDVPPTSSGGVLRDWLRMRKGALVAQYE
jgi:hypothetical protein